MLLGVRCIRIVCSLLIVCSLVGFSKLPRDAGLFWISLVVSPEIVHSEFGRHFDSLVQPDSVR